VGVVEWLVVCVYYLGDVFCDVEVFFGFFNCVGYFWVVGCVGFSYVFGGYFEFFVFEGYFDGELVDVFCD